MDSIPDWLTILLLVILVIVCGFYSSTETAFACLNKYKYKAKAQEGSRTASLILKLYDHFETTLISVLIGYNVVSIAISTLSTFLFLHWFSAFLDDGVVSLIASIAMSFVVFLFGDTIPKFIGRKIPDAVVKMNCYPMTFFVILFFPFSFLFRMLSLLFKKIFRAKNRLELTEEDFNTIIDNAEEQGVLEENESDIIQATLEFADTSVKEVLTTKRKMQMLDTSGLSNEALRLFLTKSTYSRIPLYFKNENRIVGVLIVKNYLNAYFQNPKASYLDYVQKPYFVTPSVKIDDLLDGFKKHHTQIAIVRKEGKLIGMVTMEDVLEELVGSINETSKRGGGVS